ncbi:MAG: hypothetical protein ACOH1J_07435, partial [Microbacteriaceae bacterium]
PVAAEEAQQPQKAQEAQQSGGPVTFGQVRDSWPEILEAVHEAKLNAWIVLQTATPRAYEGDVLTVSFVSENDANSFKQPNPGGDSVSEHLRGAILKILGTRVKFIARLDSAQSAPSTQPAQTAEAGQPVSGAPTPGDDEAPDSLEPEVEPGGWAVAAIPESEPPASAPRAPRAPRAPAQPSPEVSAENARYGESVVREILGASFIEEQAVAPRVVPTLGEN